MRKKTVKPQLTPNKIDALSIEQGLLIEQMMRTSVWPLIESIVVHTRTEIFEESRRVLQNNPDGNSALHWRSMEIGAERVRENFYKMVEAAKSIRNDKKQLEDLKNADL